MEPSSLLIVLLHCALLAESNVFDQPGSTNNATGDRVTSENSLTRASIVNVQGRDKAVNSSLSFLGVDSTDSLSSATENIGKLMESGLDDSEVLAGNTNTEISHDVDGLTVANGIKMNERDDSVNKESYEQNAFNEEGANHEETTYLDGEETQTREPSKSTALARGEEEEDSARIYEQQDTMSSKKDERDNHEETVNPDGEETWTNEPNQSTAFSVAEEDNSSSATIYEQQVTKSSKKDEGTNHEETAYLDGEETSEPISSQPNELTLEEEADSSSTTTYKTQDDVISTTQDRAETVASELTPTIRETEMSPTSLPTADLADISIESTSNFHPAAEGIEPSDPTDFQMLADAPVNSDFRDDDADSLPGASLAFIFDSTGSMTDELSQVKAGAGQILEAVLSNKQIVIHDLILVPFKDPEIGPVSVTTDPKKFQRMISAISVSGGEDCPEASMAAIQKALQLARPNSFFYVFTDADAKDKHHLDSVLSLIQQKQGQVVFILTGTCEGVEDFTSSGVYARVAEASSGQVYHLMKNEVEQVLMYVKEAIKPKKVNLISVKKAAPAPGTTDTHMVVVDKDLTEFTVSVAGKDAGITVKDPKGIEKTGTPSVEPLLDLKNVKVMNVKEPKPGSWQIGVKSDSEYSLRATGLSDVNFRHGFSTIPDVDIEQTNLRPLHGSSCYLLIQVPETSAVHNLTYVDVEGLNGTSVMRLPMHPHPSIPGLFVSSNFTPPAPTQFFHLGISGFSSDGSPIKRVTNTAISSSLPEKPRIAMRSKTVAKVGTPVTLSCNVTSLVPFTVEWFFQGSLIAPTAFHTQTSQVTYQISKLNETSEGNYTCVAKNLAGIFSQSTYLLATGDRPLVTSVASRKISAEVGVPVELPCHVVSDFVIKYVGWQRMVMSGGTVKSQSVHNGVMTSNHSLMIASPTEKDEGWYICTATNRKGVGESRLYLNVRNPLRVSIVPANVSYTGGQSVTLVCRVSGNPTSIEWRRDLITITNDPPYVYVEDTGKELRILLNSLDEKRAGVYSCFAFKADETENASAELIYTAKPEIRAVARSVTKQVGSNVELSCEASGVPPPTIFWRRGSQVLQPEDHLQIENGTLKITEVSQSDAGELTCVAKNTLGENQDHIWLSVGTPPTFLQKPRDKKIQLGHNGTIICSVIGSPQPDVGWSRQGTPVSSERSQILPGGGLRLTIVEISDSGTYTCTASNSFGNVTASANLTVSGIKKPSVNKMITISTVKAESGGEVTIPCGVALGNPPGTVSWLRDGKPINLTNLTLTNSTIDLLDGSLVIHSANPADDASYTCVVSSLVGNASRTFQLTILEEPHVSASEEEKSSKIVQKVMASKRIVLQCPVKGNPRPKISWSKAGSAITPSSNVYQDKDGNLVIEKADEGKSGSYTCTGTNELGSTSFQVPLEVLVPPKPITLAGLPDDKKQEVVEGYTAVLNCKMHGMPAPSVSWFKNGAPLSVHVEDATSQVLRFVATLEDNGSYKCVVSNVAGTASKEFELNILVPPRIADAGDEPVSVRAGETAELTCGVTGVPEPLVLWRRNGIYLTQNSTDATLIGHKLIVNNVTEESSGTYTCDAENSAGIAQQTFYLHVTYPPRIGGDARDQEIKIREGDELSLACTAEGSPMPQISWYKDNQPLHQYLAGVIILNDNTLMFVQVRPEHAGTYTCRANNSEGTSDRKYLIEVTSPPGLLFDTDEYTLMEVNEGENLTLTCPTSGSSYTVHWLKNGRPLIGPLRERSDEPPMRFSGDKRQLVISEAHPVDSGNYSCVATNLAGRVDATFLVVVLMTPHFEEFNHVARRTVLVGGSVSLNCSVSGNPPPQVSWRKDVYPIVSGRPPGVVLSRDQHHLVIPNARIYHTGTYTCIATNKIMIKEREFYVTVLEPPSIPGDVQEDLELMIGTRLALQCPADGEPRPQITWYQDDCDGNKRTLNITDSTLVVNEVTADHSTTFYCEAESTAGTAAKTFNVTVLAAPFIEGNEGMENVQVREGDELALRCVVKGRPRPYVTWLHNGVEVEVSRRRRREISGEPPHYMEGEEVLQLGRADRYAQGIYTVVASNRAGFSEKMFRVQVAVPPKRTKNDTKTTVMSGRTAILQCPIEATPPPNVTWQHLGSHLAANGSKYILSEKTKLAIEKVTSDDEGEYSCTASNAAGNITVVVQLVVLQPPWFPEGDRESIKAIEGQHIVLNCSSKGKPTPTITWLRGLQLLPFKDTELTVSNVSAEAEGEYTCLASNEVGAAEKYFEVHVVIPPTAKPAPDGPVQVLLHRHLQLSCDVQTPSDFNTTWYKVDNGTTERQFLTTDPRYFIANADSKHVGLYECVAENEAGKSLQQFEVEVYVQAIWTAWSEWSECSATCGHGLQTRQRNCSHGPEVFDFRVQVDKSLCVGSEQEEQECDLEECPVDGGWSEWSEWRECSVSCGNGTKHRERTCSHPWPAHGGRPCQGDALEISTCYNEACPSLWSDWSDWGECSKSCGKGERARWRNCLSSNNCDGSYIEKEICNTQPCRKKRGRWSPWSECSKTCGNGMKKRVRRCNSRVLAGKTCEDNVEFEPCYLRPCAAELTIRGQLNGNEINSHITANISGQHLTARTRDFSWLPPEPVRRPPQHVTDPYLSAKWYPYTPFLLSPVAWNAANEEGSAANGFSLTGGRFLTQSDVTFATGEKLTMHAKGEGTDSKGMMTVIIEVTGEAPIVEPTASLRIKTLSQDFVQVAEGSLMGQTDDFLMMNDQPVPYHVNTSVTYDPSKGKMPYLVENLRVTEIDHDDTPEDGREWRVSASVSKKYDENVCPPGSQEDHQHMLCQDIDECLQGSCSLNQECTNTWGSYTCMCRDGYEIGPSRNCRDRNECEEEPEICHHSCVNTEGSFFCLCSMGYTLGPDGTSCLGEEEEEEDETSDESRDVERIEPYSTNQYNLEEFSSRNQWPRHAPVPSCMPGYQLAADYSRCEDVDECLSDEICGEDGLCINTRGSYQCLDVSCPIGFQRQTPTTCRIECHTGLCRHGAAKAESVVYALLSLKTDTFRPLEDLLQLRVHGEMESSREKTRARILEGHALRLRTDGDYASLYAPISLSPNTLYRVVAVVESWDSSRHIQYATEFVVFVVLSNN